MRRVVFNQKGGVGKSSITCNLAAIAANSGKRTLLLDLDPQGNSTQYLLGENPDTANTIADYFSQTLSFNLSPKKPAEFITETPFANLSIMASDPELEEIEQKLESRHKIYKLRDLLNKLEPHFDQVFIDTAPAMNFYTTSALVSADRVLIPFDCDAFSRHALYNILHVIGEIRDDHNEDLLIEGIIANQFQPRANLPTQIINELIAEKHPVLPIYLNQSVKMRESHQAGKPLIHFAPSHPLTLQFLALHDHLNNKKRTKKTTAR
ncbi:MAG: ParA family protein [Porticoccus sp.]|mgnify:CR=1 FL=1|jgi:chromosome partitioning protein|uniref:ParA family protein n=1 Tax=Porticoccus sp. TaxID=2024853 RepID=UPI003298F8A4